MRDVGLCTIRASALLLRSQGRYDVPAWCYRVPSKKERPALIYFSLFGLRSQSLDRKRQRSPLPARSGLNRAPT